MSKIRNGKKIPGLKITDVATLKDDFFEADNNAITEVLIELNDKDIIIDNSSIIEYIETQMKKCIIHAKMYQIILNKLKGDK